MSSCTRCGTQVSKQGSQWQGQPVCDECFRVYLRELQAKPVPTIVNNNENETNLYHLKETPTKKGISLNDVVNNAILWQKNEKPLGQMECKEFFEDRTISLGARIGHKGFLVVTDQRLLFACKLGFLSQEYAVTYGINLENIVTVSHGRFGFNDKLVILENNNQHRDFVQPQIHSLIPIINSATTEKKNQLIAEKQREHVQIVLDFSSLKDVMAKGGLVMTTYKCPNCNGMVSIPEAGKILMCQYCQTPIKPVDIFEKIKSLIQ